LEPRQLLSGFGWAVKAGSPLTDSANTVATDSAGNVYVAGVFMDTATFSSAPGAASNTVTLASFGDYDGFVAKYAPDGYLAWAVRLGGANWDEPTSIAVSSDGNTIYVAGDFVGTNSDLGLTSTPGGGRDVFVARLNWNGSLNWAKKTGGPSNFSQDEANDIAIAPDGGAYVAGEFGETVDFDPNAGYQPLTSNGGYDDIFVLKLTASGTYGWAKAVGGTGIDRGQGIATAGNGGAIVTGYFVGSNVNFNRDGSYPLSAVGGIGQHGHAHLPGQRHVRGRPARDRRPRRRGHRRHHRDGPQRRAQPGDHRTAGQQPGGDPAHPGLHPARSRHARHPHLRLARQRRRRDLRRQRALVQLHAQQLRHVHGERHGDGR
jgi:hypothetical protein